MIRQVWDSNSQRCRTPIHSSLPLVQRRHNGSELKKKHLNRILSRLIISLQQQAQLNVVNFPAVAVRRFCFVLNLGKSSFFFLHN